MVLRAFEIFQVARRFTAARLTPAQTALRKGAADFTLAFLFILLSSSPLRAAEPWLSSLATPPEWRLLDRYQKSITRAEFEELLKQVYSVDGDFLRYVDLTDDKAVVWRDQEKTYLLWTLEFAPSSQSTQNRPSLFYPTDTVDLRSASADQPLKGLRILLDPGHIGGDWAYMEQRDLQIGKNPPIQEASLNLLACRQLPFFWKTPARKFFGQNQS